jgi:hypothetical protein
MQLKLKQLKLNQLLELELLLELKGDFFGFFLFFMSDIQHCFICRPSNSTVSEDL